MTNEKRETKKRRVRHTLSYPDVYHTALKVLARKLPYADNNLSCVVRTLIKEKLKEIDPVAFETIFEQHYEDKNHNEKGT